MKAITLLCLYLFLGITSKAQSDISNIALEIQGESTMLVSSLEPLKGTQLYYSKSKKKIIKQNDPDFASDNSLLILKPLLKIFKKSDVFPDNNTLSLTFQTSEIVDGIELRNSINCDYNISFLKVAKWTRIDALTHQLEVGNVDDFYRIFQIVLNPSNSFCISSRSVQKVLKEVLLMKDIKLTIINGKKVN